MKLAFASLFVLAACGPKSSSTTKPEPDNAGGGPPVYTSLFQMGATWTLAVHSEHDGGDEETRSSEDVVAVCQVDRVDEFDGGKLANISCDEQWPSPGWDPLVGVWAMTDAGVWHLTDWPEGAPELDPKAMMLSATPKADSHEQESEESGYAAWAIKQQGDAWCYEESSAMGDESWISLCLDASGPTEGTFGWAGGSVHDNKFTRQN